MLEKYGHGGDLRTAEEMFGRKGAAFLDFSSNMNPLGPPAAVREALLGYDEHISVYPDPAVRGLRRKLAAHHGIGEFSILIGNGAAELIDLTVRALSPDATALAVPSFNEYGDAVRKQGGRIFEIPLRRDQAFRLTEDAVGSAIRHSGASLYMIGSPNNPTGALVDPALIRLLLEHDRYVAVDEAFMDFVEDERHWSMLSEASVHERLIVLRSMTKFYSIPGIRLGYAVGHPDTIAKLRRLQIPWSVNSLAQNIGEAVLDDTDFAIRTKEWLAEERRWLQGELARREWEVCPGVANYLLLKLPESSGLDAPELQRRMGQRGVLIRDASHFAGLDRSFVRVAVKLRPQNEQLLAALEECLKEAGGEPG